MGVVRALVLVDVDGVLSPFAAKVKPDGFVEHKFRLAGWSRRRPLRMWLNPGHGQALLAAAGDAELVWATSWEHQANTMMGPAIGLPVLPVIEFHGDGSKFAAVARYAGDRPLVWLDDDFDLDTRARDAFLAERDGIATELVRVDPHMGIAGPELAAVRAFAG
jgi:hypothetical protein